MGGDRLITVLDAQILACPRCAAQLMFCRSQAPRFDACGFEAYSLECKECGAALAGIIDPADQALLLSDLGA